MGKTPKGGGPSGGRRGPVAIRMGARGGSVRSTRPSSIAASGPRHYGAPEKAPGARRGGTRAAKGRELVG